MDLEKKITVLDFQIPKCPEFEVKSKIGKIFKNHNPLLLKLMKLTLIFINIMKKKKVDKSGCRYILFRIDVYFNKLLLAVEIDEKDHTDRDLIFEKKRQEALE